MLGCSQIFFLGEIERQLIVGGVFKDFGKKRNKLYQLTVDDGWGSFFLGQPCLAFLNFECPDVMVMMWSCEIICTTVEGIVSNCRTKCYFVDRGEKYVSHFLSAAFNIFAAEYIQQPKKRGRNFLGLDGVHGWGIQRNMLAANSCGREEGARVWKG